MLVARLTLQRPAINGWERRDLGDLGGSIIALTFD